MNQQVLPGTCFSMSSPESYCPLGYTHFLTICCFNVDPQRYKGTAMVFTMGCRWISAVEGTSSSSDFTDFGVCRVASLPPSHFCLQLLLSSRFSPILKYVIIEAQLQLVTSLSWTQLALTLLDLGEASGIFSQKPQLKFLLLLNSCHVSQVHFERDYSEKKVNCYHLYKSKLFINKDACNWNL